MHPIKIMANGIPGNMAVTFAAHAINDGRFALIPYALTGPEITGADYILGSESIRLIHPDERDRVIPEIITAEGAFISVDFSHPAAVNHNAAFYCRHNLPFVMGTTGGQRQALEDAVRLSSIPAVIAPNMAKQIVGFQTMMAYAAEMFPDLFKGYSLTIAESHQKGKADTSGTAKAMIGYFNAMGVPFSEHDIIKERNPEVQRSKLGVPEEHLSGHAWHTYTLLSEDQTVSFSFSHNVNGRDVYALGTLDAVVYLDAKIRQGVQGTVFDMIDVLKGL
ncbi:MAG: dihydrodipicolinate reductase [Desulfobacterales bacterium]|nr:dihydrodipicolinate reductase [Desulfobacterales bacterium]